MIGTQETTRKANMKKDKPNYRPVLAEHAQRIATETINSINNSVPAKVEGMPYARQHVLEEVIKILQASV